MTVFVRSIVTDSMSKMFGFPMVSSSWVIIFDCVIGYNKLEAVLGCLYNSNKFYVTVVWIFYSFWWFGSFS